MNLRTHHERKIEGEERERKKDCSSVVVFLVVLVAVVLEKTLRLTFLCRKLGI